MAAVSTVPNRQDYNSKKNNEEWPRSKKFDDVSNLEEMEMDGCLYVLVGRSGRVGSFGQSLGR